MSQKNYLSTYKSFPQTAATKGRGEYERHTDLIRKAIKENGKKEIRLEQEMLLEDLIRLHILEQRLFDQRVFWDGSATTFCKTGKHEFDLSKEDSDRKDKEFKEWYSTIHSAKMDIIKVLKGYKLDLSGMLNAQSYFNAADEQRAKELREYMAKRNGEKDTNGPTTRLDR